MRQEDKSITALSKSNTSSSKNDSKKSKKGETKTELDTPIQFVKGVGPKLGIVFGNRNIKTIYDLLRFYPRTYEDRSHFQSIHCLTDGMKTTVSVRVQGIRQIPVQKTRRTILEVRCSDGTGTLHLKWFYPPRGMESRFTPGAQFLATGKVKVYLGKPEMIHPEISWGVTTETVIEGQPDVGRIIPVYTEIEGVPTRTLRKVLWEALQKYESALEEDLPVSICASRKLMPVRDAVRSLHFPPDSKEFDLKLLENFSTPAHKRLIYEEFFKFEYLIFRQRLDLEKSVAVRCGGNGGVKEMNRLIQILPFQLTSGQILALQEILHDFGLSHPMNRLIQGDVGSGKTAVAFLTAACILAEGGQAALMAPTEILAEQHYHNAISLFKGELSVSLLTGKTPVSERIRISQNLNLGMPILLIGTHALIEDWVKFSNLVYVMIDEQHRFGVDQRKALKEKGIRMDPESKQKVLPHSLILTATPIPRTLALTVYGELSVSSIKELPPGRSPIETKVVKDRSQRIAALQRIKSELRSGRQAYFIYPLINDSEAEGFTQLKSAVVESERLATEIFPEFSVGLLHGQLKSDEKANVMARFKSGEIHILVSTTVVEVGVDVPNATIMCIQHSERFGLSQLHQLRGRVGRGQHQSYCFLFSSVRGEEAASPTSQRLEVLEESTDGFKIAEADLEIRGPGEFLGIRQAGGLPFRLANLVRDQDLLMAARDDVMELMKIDPNLSHPDRANLRTYFDREGRIYSDRLGTS